MKGVTSLRFKLRPQAECQRRDCGWGQIAGMGATAAAVRGLAQQHVKATGHPVHVTISDITEYRQDGGAPEETRAGDGRML